MPSTYTSNTGIEKPGSGEQSGTWGTTTNTNFDIIDEALHGQASIAISGDTDLVTNDGTTSNGVNSVILLTGTPGSAFELRITPTDQEKHFTIKNDTNAICTVVYKGVTAVVGTNAVSIPVSKTKSVSGDGAGASGVVTELLTNDINTNVVADLTPQLGGNLDLNTHNITGTGNVNITGTITSTGAISSGASNITTTGTVSAGTVTASANITASGTVAGANVSGSSTVTVGGWTFSVDGSNNLVFTYGGNTVAKIATNGAITSENDITAFGSV